jgi:hypothetical protein
MRRDTKKEREREREREREGRRYESGVPKRENDIANNIRKRANKEPERKRGVFEERTRD